MSTMYLLVLYSLAEELNKVFIYLRNAAEIFSAERKICPKESKKND